MKEGEVADKNRGRSVDDNDDDRISDDLPEDVDAELTDDDASAEDDADDDVDGDDADDDELDEAELDDDELEDDDDDAKASEKPGRTRGRSGAVATKAKVGAVARSKSKDDRSVGIFGRLANFVREVVAELQKVIWPTRKELLTYTTVVVVFVAIMMSFVAGLDVGFARLMFVVFGGDSGS